MSALWGHLKEERWLLVEMATTVCAFVLSMAEGDVVSCLTLKRRVLWKQEQKAFVEDKMEENGLSERVLEVRQLVPGKVNGANARMG